MGTKEGRERGRSGAQLISYRGNFIVGAATTIKRRLLADKKESDTRPATVPALTADGALRSSEECVPSQAGALVLLKQPKVEAFFEQEYPNTSTARTRGYSDQSALYHGKAAGEKIPLHRSVENGKPVGQLGVS